MKTLETVLAVLLALALLPAPAALPVRAHTVAGDLNAAVVPEARALRPMEYLGRGLVAAKVSGGVFLSWRFLGNEPDDVAFNVYRDGQKIATVTGKSNYLDPDGLPSSLYEVGAVINGREYSREASFRPVITSVASGTNPGAYFDIPLKRPPAARVPAIQAYATTVTGKQYEPVNMNLLREFRVAYTDALTVTQAQFESWVNAFRGYFNDPAWTPTNVFTDGAVLSEALYRELEAAFIRYCDELDRGPKLQWRRNADGTLYTTSATYTVNDISPADLDGDGEYELVVRWEPSNQRDSMYSDPVYAGVNNNTASSPTIIDGIKLDGTVLWRINIGYNMRAGQHDTQLQVADFDGDGKAEVILKTADGTTTGTVDENGNYTVTGVVGDPNATFLKFEEYMTNGDVESIEKYWSVINSYSIGYRQPGGNASPNDPTWVKIYCYGPMGTGNEYVTAFDGETGAIIDTTDFPFPYGDKAWGALPVQERGGYVTRIEPQGRYPAQLDPNEAYWLEHPWGHYPWGDHQGNRANRYLGAVGLLDGQRWSAIISRGYYHRTTISAFTIVDGKLVVQGTFDSAAEEDWYQWQNRSNHSLAVYDIDGDGRDEILYSAANFKLIDGAIRPVLLVGTMMPGRGTAEPPANSNLITPEIENAPTSVWLPMRHGDRHALLPVDATNRLLYYSCREEWIANDIRDGKNYGWLPGWTLHDPLTGRVLVAIYSGNDYDGGTAGNFDPRYESVEVYTGRGNAYNASTLQPLPYALNTNAHAFWWDGDLIHELIDTTVVRKFNPATNSLVTVFQPSGVSSGAGKNMPQLQADLFGDWREEYIVRYGNTALRVFTTVTPTEYGIRTLMHDPLYRNDVALQNSTYNMSPHTSFFLGPNSPLPARRADIEITLSGIVSEVLQPEPITVLYGTGWSELSLPGQVLVKVDTGAYRRVGVEWDSAGYDPLSATAQTICGRLLLTDRIFNPDELEARVQVNVVYGFAGVLPPLESAGAAALKLGSTVPVRFRLVDARDASITDAEVRIFVAKVSDGVAEQFSEAVSTVAQQGNVARYDTEEALYIFNLSTRGLTPGTYRILIDPGDGTQHMVDISLR